MISYRGFSTKIDWLDSFGDKVCVCVLFFVIKLVIKELDK